MEGNQERISQNSSKAKFNKNHIQGFILGVLIMAILVSSGLFIYFSNDRDNNLLGALPYNQYVIIEDFDKEVLQSSEQTLVYFNDLSLSFDRLTQIYDNIYENNKYITKTYIATKDTYSFIESIGIRRYNLPCFAMFENGKLKSVHSLDLKEVSVIQWLAPFNQARIYRAFPSSAFDSIGRYYDLGYFLSELCLMPERSGLGDFLKLSGDMTLPLQGNTALYALLTDKFGGDNKTYFGLPNLDSQIPATGLNYFIATKGYFPERDDEYNRVSYIDGNIKYLEFSIEDIHQNMFIGQIILAKNVDEEKYENLLLPCDGRMLRMYDYPALGSLLGNKFGGDGANNFQLPDLSNVHSPINGAKYYIMLRLIYPTND
ncbi:MAG: tail fiber protein [Eubacteriales bacterium]|nr:tail fiber protein [Eubacteriales bacterium]MDD4476302.1 tail fiber protein [Eubacteriales bacterium]